ncbi:MAG: KH domain-containing protein [Chlamydiota bacterium]
MEEFINYIVKNLVDDPDAVNVRTLEGSREILVEIRVAKNDIGKVVGSKGRTINALRTIASIVATKLGRRVRLELIE